MQQKTYYPFLMLAIGIHLFLGILLFWEHSSDHPVVMTMAKPSETVQAIQAVSVDSSQVNQVVEQLKKERQEAAQKEVNRQKALAQQAEMMRKQRLAEQQQLARLKAEAADLALKQKQKIEQEKAQLRELAKQQETREKALKVLKEKQETLALQQKQAKEKLEKEQLAQQKAQALAAKQAQMAGVVDRYKALIIQAIGHEWILPEQVDRKLSSQFRIRLAPSGSVLEVTLIRSSGDPVLDRSAQSAIYKASPLPVPSDAHVFEVFREISLTVRPENVQG